MVFRYRSKLRDGLRKRLKTIRKTATGPQKKGQRCVEEMAKRLQLMRSLLSIKMKFSTEIAQEFLNNLQRQGLPLACSLLLAALDR